MEEDQNSLRDLSRLLKASLQEHHLGLGLASGSRPLPLPHLSLYYTSSSISLKEVT